MHIPYTLLNSRTAQCNLLEEHLYIVVSEQKWMLMDTEHERDML